jgi:PPOX class probable F420-dependent enzyme
MYLVQPTDVSIVFEGGTFGRFSIGRTAIPVPRIVGPSGVLANSLRQGFPNLAGGGALRDPVWVGTDGERLVVNTETHRRKYKNVERDPNVTLMIRHEENPYRYAEVRGQVVEKVTGQEARDHIDELSQKYHGQDYNPDDIVSERVMLWIVPSRQTLVDQTASSID